MRSRKSKIIGDYSFKEWVNIRCYRYDGHRNYDLFFRLWGLNRKKPIHNQFYRRTHPARIGGLYEY